MRTDDFPRFHAVLAGMTKLYEREIDGPLLDAYWLALRDWPLEEFEHAAGHLMAVSRFMPRPADFHELRRAGRMTAGEAWAAALQHARGAWRSGPAIGEVESAVQSLGGWPVIAMATLERLPFLERRFSEIYAELESRTESRAALPNGAADRGGTLKLVAKETEKPPERISTAGNIRAAGELIAAVIARQPAGVEGAKRPGGQK